jgi:hypothetical protein
VGLRFGGGGDVSPMSAIERIRENLVRLRRLDPDCRAFGANGHRYLLNPPVAEAAVESIERRYAITLPGAYRRFVLEVGDGLAGPDYGLSPLEKAQFRPPVPLVPLAYDQRGFQEPVDDPEESNRDAPSIVLGARLVLGGSGCGGINVLVVSGPESGRVWREERSFGEFWPGKRDFLEWYEAWLNQWLTPGKLEAWIARTRPPT